MVSTNLDATRHIRSVEKKQQVSAVLWNYVLVLLDNNKGISGSQMMAESYQSGNHLLSTRRLVVSHSAFAGLAFLGRFLDPS